MTLKGITHTSKQDKNITLGRFTKACFDIT